MNRFFFPIAISVFVKIFKVSMELTGPPCFPPKPLLANKYSYLICALIEKASNGVYLKFSDPHVLNFKNLKWIYDLHVGRISPLAEMIMYYQIVGVSNGYYHTLEKVFSDLCPRWFPVRFKRFRFWYESIWSSVQFFILRSFNI